VLNTRELAGLLGFPLDDVKVPGLTLGAARQLPPPPDLPRKGFVVAHSNYSEMTSRPLALKQADMLHHLHLLGPTGSGKSTLIENLALQAARRGDGMFVVDPKADLCEEILARLPEDRTEDVMTVNPAATDRPIGFNLLQSAQDEHARELVVDDVVHICSEVWASSFGPRSADVLRNTLLTLTATKAPDGSAFTLAEVAPTLENPTFRRFVTAQPGVPESVRSFWIAYDAMSAGERRQIIGPSLNKLRALTTRTSLRLMLGQSKGLDVADVFTKRRILLASLNKGIVGTETAQLVGALLVAGLRNAALRRAAIPREARRPAWAFLDEFQDVLRMGGDLADGLAQARGLGLIYVLANQYLGQLPPPTQAALGTVRSSVVFQLDHDDARALERRFSPSLTTEDLMGLGAYEIAARLCIDGQTRPPVTGKALPLEEPIRDAFALIKASRERYGVPRTEVEARLRARVPTIQAVTTFGRRQGVKA
jgi:energy-coupling factor transporter ATP-binding protein EcfA2